MVITFLYLFLEFKYRKNDQFSHLCLFGNLESILDTQFKYKIHHYPVYHLNWIGQKGVLKQRFKCSNLMGSSFV